MYCEVPMWLRQPCGKEAGDGDSALAGRTVEPLRPEGCARGDKRSKSENGACALDGLALTLNLGSVSLYRNRLV